MIIKLELRDRIILLQNMPEQKDIDTVETMVLLSVSDTEKQEFGYRVEDNRIKWDENIDTERDFTLSVDQLCVINSIVTQMNKDGLIDMSNYSTYKKIKSL